VIGLSCAGIVWLGLTAWRNLRAGT